MRHAILSGIALALLSVPSFAANELPSIGAPNGTVRSTPSAIIVPTNPATPGGAGCVVGSTGCSLTVNIGGSGSGGALCTDSAGVICSPKAGVANRVITKTSVAASTSTTVCPTATTPVTTEIQVQTGGIGLGLNGQTLSSVAYGTATTNPDLIISTAGALYTMPVAATNLITAYGAAQVVTCIQTLRQ